jgi:hypothetical protein
MSYVFGGGRPEFNVRNAYSGMSPANSKLGASSSVPKASRLKEGAEEIEKLQRELDQSLMELERLEDAVKKYKERNQEEREHTTQYKSFIEKKQSQIEDEKMKVKSIVKELGHAGMTSKMTQEEEQKLALAREKAGGVHASEIAKKKIQEQALKTGMTKEEKEQKWWDKHGGGLRSPKEALAHTKKAYSEGTDTFGKGVGGGGGGGGGGSYKHGGIVKGKKGKAVPIVAHAGELVVPTAVVSKVLKSSAWIDHVKSVQKQHGISYKEAMKIAKGSYTK